MSETSRDEIAQRLAEKFSTAVGERNPDWDWEQPDGPDNRYHFERPMSERIKGSPWIHFTADDGNRSMRVPTFYELADALLPLVDTWLTEARAEGEQRGREEVLTHARSVITQYLGTAEKWRYDRVCWAFAIMLGEIPADSPEPLSPADEAEIARRAAMEGTE